MTTAASLDWLTRGGFWHRVWVIAAILAFALLVVFLIEQWRWRP